MTVAYWCVLVMILFPYVFTILAKTGSGFNNYDPRAYLANLTGWRKRAHYIQLNSFEAISPFVAAVIIAHLVQADQSMVDRLAATFVMIRAVYAVCYLNDSPTLRSICWALGMGCVVALFFA